MEIHVLKSNINIQQLYVGQVNLCSQSRSSLTITAITANVGQFI